MSKSQWEMARPNEAKLQEILENGCDWEQVAQSLLSWLSDDEVGDFARTNGYFDEEEDEEEIDDDVDWKVSSDEYEYGEGNKITFKGSAMPFNFKVGDWITVGFLDDFGDVDYRRLCKVIEKTPDELICTWHF